MISRPPSSERPKSPAGRLCRSLAKESASLPRSFWTPGSKLEPDDESCMAKGTSTVNPPMELIMAWKPQKVVSAQ
jgi:hypothetical protein